MVSDERHSTGQYPVDLNQAAIQFEQTVCALVNQNNRMIYVTDNSISKSIVGEEITGAGNDRATRPKTIPIPNTAA